MGSGSRANQAGWPAWSVPRGGPALRPCREEQRIARPYIVEVIFAEGLMREQMGAVGLLNVVPARLGRQRFKPDRAAGAQQSCPTSPHEPSHVRPSAPLKRPATRGLVVDAVAGIPRWHARGQGFKSPQLHQAQRLSRPPAQGRLPEICQSLTASDRRTLSVADRFSRLGSFAASREPS
jgi:hypothetical protein